MRMDPDAEITAAELINNCEEEELARVFYEYGEERASRRIASAIVQKKKKSYLIVPLICKFSRINFTEKRQKTSSHKSFSSSENCCQQ